jgi:hypothetical protein
VVGCKRETKFRAFSATLIAVLSAKALVMRRSKVSFRSPGLAIPRLTVSDSAPCVASVK